MHEAYARPHYTIVVTVIEVNEWGDTLNKCLEMGVDMVSPNLVAMVLAAESLQGEIMNHINKHAEANSLSPLAPARH